MKTNRGVQPDHRRVHALTIVEAMMGMAVLSVGVLAVNYAVVAGQSLSHTGDDAMRAVDLAQDLMEEILALPYHDPGGISALGPEVGETVRSDFDNTDDFHGYSESAGAITDFAGNLYDNQGQVFSRTVSMTTTTESVSDLAAAIVGLTVTVTVTDSSGRSWSITRFTSESAP